MFIKNILSIQRNTKEKIEHRQTCLNFHKKTKYNVTIKSPKLP